jgi:very-short-patch-repair endonuclease
VPGYRLSIRLRRQVETGDDERWLARVDFRDEVLPLVVEVQSEELHSAPVDKVHDAHRLEALRKAGFEVVEVTDLQVWHEPDLVTDKVREARLRVLASHP